MVSPLAPKPTVLVIGGGIGGLVAALYLRQYGFAVTVLERKESFHDGNSSGGLSLTRNATRCFDDLGIGERFRDIADVGNGLYALRYTDARLQDHLPSEPRTGLHRADLLNLLDIRAAEVGVEMIMGKQWESLHGTTVQLASGRTIIADLILGADGINSKVRQVVLQTDKYKPELTGQAVFLFYVPRSMVEQSKDMQDLYKQVSQPLSLTPAPGRSVVSWVMTKRGVLHHQFNDHQYGTGQAYGMNDHNPEYYVSPLDDLSGFRQRWGDYGGGFRTILEKVPNCTKWLIAELPDLPRWSSATDNIVLLGDAAHAFPPFAGQGAAMAIEDAATLSTLIAKAVDSNLPVRSALEAFEKMRRPRIELIRSIIAANVAKWSATKPIEPGSEPTEQVIEGRRYAKVDGYNAVEEAQQYPLS